MLHTDRSSNDPLLTSLFFVFPSAFVDRRHRSPRYHDRDRRDDRRDSHRSDDRYRRDDRREDRRPRDRDYRERDDPRDRRRYDDDDRGYRRDSYRDSRDDRGRHERKERKPSTERRSPTPPGTVPLSQRRRKASGWDVHAPGYEQYSAMQAKQTGQCIQGLCYTP